MKHRKIEKSATLQHMLHYYFEITVKNCPYPLDKKNNLSYNSPSRN